MRKTEMKYYGDYHTHTFASDGRCSVSAHAKKAKERGLSEIAITDHSFASFVFHMTEKKFAKQKRRISSYDGVKILQGIEANIVNENGDIDVPDDVIRQCDVLHLGFHRFLGLKYIAKAKRFILVNGYCGKRKRESLIKINTQAYVTAMKKYPIDCIAHINHRAIVDVAEVCRAAKENGVYIELNAKHLDVIEDFAEEILSSGVNLLVGTDAHDARKTGMLEKAESFVERHRIPLERVFGLFGNPPVFKDKKEWKKNEL